MRRVNGKGQAHRNEIAVRFLLIIYKFELGVFGKSDGLHCHIVACCMQRSVLMDMAYAELQH